METGETVDLKNWADFEKRIAWLDDHRRAIEAQRGRPCYAPIFRGHGCADWPLATTLERAFPIESCERNPTFLSYYRKVTAAHPFIQSLMEHSWPDLPDYPTLSRSLREFRGSWLDFFLNQHLAVYRFLIYLRHHGFPSPLLDWTASPYIAAFFAFDSMHVEAKHIVVYAFLWDTLHGFSSEQHFFVVGPYIETDRRHFLQQSRYSMCVGLEKDDYRFVPHEGAMVGPGGTNGELYKFLIPVEERSTALRRLDLMGINRYSLIGTEDALVKTIARRECLFAPWEL